MSVLYIFLYYILAYIQHKGDVSLENYVTIFGVKSGL